MKSMKQIFKKTSVQFFASACLLLALTSCTGPTVKEQFPAPSSPPAQEKFLPKAQKSVRPSTHKIGILLPLSGPHEALGKELLNAAELALFDAQSPSLVLRPYDVGKSPQTAVNQALKDGVELLVGPIFANDVKAIRPLLENKNVNLLCFSTDQTVAGNGVYLLGFLPPPQIERVIGYIKDKGIKRIAAIIPLDAYGKVVEQTLQKLDSQGDISLVGIIHNGNTADAGEDLEASHLIADIELYKTKGLEALLVPEGGRALAHIIQTLGVQESLQLLGSGQWDTPETLAIPGTDGALFASIPPEDWKDFATRFQKVYGGPPSRIAGLSYDAIALAAALENKGYTAKDLTHHQGFSGTTGLFRLTSKGLNERELAILKVTPEGFTLVSPAPRTF